MKTHIKSTRALALCAALAISLAAIAGCTPGGPSSSVPDIPAEVLPGVNADNYPRVDGSTANLPLMAQIYADICGVSIEDAETIVSASGGTGAVWRNMMYYGADLLLVYEAPEGIKREIDGQRLSLEIEPLGRDALVFLVNIDNPVESLAVEQLVGIYTGEITDWAQVGGTPGPIAPYQRNAESGSQTLFLKLLMGDTEPMIPPKEFIPSGMGELIEAVAQFSGEGGAIGYSVYYYASLMYNDPNLKIISVDGVEPSKDSIASEQYPLTNDFYSVIRTDAPADSPERLLRDWLYTDAGRRAMEAQNYIVADRAE